MQQDRTITYLQPVYFLMFSLLFFSLTVSAQSVTSLDDVKRVVTDGLAEGSETQQKIDDIDDRRAKLANQYRATLKQNASLKKYNDMLRQTIESQKASINDLKQQIDRVSNLEREILPLMSEMLDTLENFIALDMPFLEKERKDRVQNLKALLADGDISNSEKYRRILEAYQIENDYGRTVEAYESILAGDDGTEKTVTFLKIGRIAFLYQTLDMTESYIWLQNRRVWTRLDSSYNSGISQGIRMAKELIPSDLMFVPIDTSNLNSTAES